MLPHATRHVRWSFGRFLFVVSFFGLLVFRTCKGGEPIRKTDAILAQAIFGPAHPGAPWDRPLCIFAKIDMCAFHPLSGLRSVPAPGQWFLRSQLPGAEHTRAPGDETEPELTAPHDVRAQTACPPRGARPACEVVRSSAGGPCLIPTGGRHARRSSARRNGQSLLHTARGYILSYPAPGQW